MECKKTPKLAEDKLAVDYDEEDFSSSLPHLYSELKDQNHWARVPIHSLEREEDLPPAKHINTLAPDSEDKDSDPILPEIDESEDEMEGMIPESHGYSGDVDNLEDDISVKLQKKSQKPLTDEEEARITISNGRGFFRRCHTAEEAIEIIDYMVNCEDISLEKAELLKYKINTEGLATFGPQKTWGYFERKYRKEFTEGNSE